jgi:hypothetical protein
MAADNKHRHLPKEINSILAYRNDTVSALYHHALELIDLQNQLKALLPAPLDSHVAVASCRNGILTVHADSAAWAARLRFEVPAMLEKINETARDAHVQTIRVKVRPPESIREPDHQKLSLSEDSARLLRDVAESISDPELRDSLLRIARHH